MTAPHGFHDHFDDPVPNTAVWVPHYLPQWSSRAASAAVYDIADSWLRLRVPEQHPSVARTTIRRCASRASSPGSSPVRWAAPSGSNGCARAPSFARSGRRTGGGRPGTAVSRCARGRGSPLDPWPPGGWSGWRPDRAVFLVDGRPVRTVGTAPDYPMQTMLAVFDFPDRAVPGEPYVEPELVIDHIRAGPSGHDG